MSVLNQIIRSLQGRSIRQKNGLYSLGSIMSVRHYPTIPPVHRAATSGDFANLKLMLTDVPEAVDWSNRHGDTPLTVSAEHGHAENIKTLLSFSAETSIRNKNGHTALDLSQLYRHRECYDLLKDETKTSPVINFFDDNPLNRLAAQRSNKTFLFQEMANPETVFILFHKSKPIISHKEERFATFKPKNEDVVQFIDPRLQNLIFLGRQEVEGKDGVSWFAVEVKDMGQLKEHFPDENLDTLPMYPGAIQLQAQDAAIYGQARSLFDWQYRFRHCPSCGSNTEVQEAGYKLVCLNMDCMSHRGVYNSNYPRVDPTVISAVISADREQCLLARKASFPPGMFTAIAGFVEPGESMEAACRREVAEEVGLRVGEVRYHSSQPWPNPSALMLGCIAYVTEPQGIKLDKQELQEARWFPREEIVSMLCRKHPDRLFIPPHQAIAHQIIKAWCLETAFKNM